MIKALGFLPGCPAGEHYDSSVEVCVPDTYGGGAAASGNTLPDPPEGFLKYALMGLAALVVLGAFAGGRASGKRSASKGRLLSRTTTRSIFG